MDSPLSNVSLIMGPDIRSEVLSAHVELDTGRDCDDCLRYVFPCHLACFHVE